MIQELGVNGERLSEKELRSLACSRARTELCEIKKKVKDEKDRPKKPLERAIANVEFVQSIINIGSVNEFLRSSQRPVEICAKSCAPFAFAKSGLFVFNDGIHPALVSSPPFGGKVLRVWWGITCSPKQLEIALMDRREGDLVFDVFSEFSRMSKVEIVKKFERAIK